MDDKKKQDNSLNIELTADVADGTYANLAIISHSASEFIIDYVSIMPGMPKAKVKSRIVMTPNHAKRLLRALNENIMKYEKTFGEITEHEQVPPYQMFTPAGEA
ncbi:hypothetical protein SDC9_58485 [bioreactor metagenome]|uniref:DUF3467 domain-containing protein n=1 Tax=bioreactor metagenome TaxID=1076179 RepID=A0A644XD67_9ZZZZ